MLYMLLLCYDPSMPRDTSQPNLQPEHAKLERELRERALFVSGAGLWPVEAAKNIRTQDGQTLVTDGPFAETKEAVGGYYIVDCDEAEAVAIATRIHSLRPEGEAPPRQSRGWVQVRPIGLFHPNVARISQMPDA